MEIEIKPGTSHDDGQLEATNKIHFESQSIDCMDNALRQRDGTNDGYNFEVPLLDPTSIKQEEEDFDSEQCENEAPDDAKVEKFEGGECSYSEWTPHQFLTIEIASPSKNENNSEPVENKVKVNESEVKSIILSQETVARITVRKESFNRRNFACGICFEFFGSSRSLKIHQVAVHNRLENVNDSGDKPLQLRLNGKRILKCDRCDFRSDNIVTLKLHKIAHIDDRPFKCDQCNFTCRYSAHLKLHRIKHTRDIPFKCDLCDYKTSQSSHFRAHTLSHTGEKPLQCDQCDFKCAYSSSLKFHKASHSDEKPYKCDLCYYQTAHRDYLKRHTMTHTGDKPYKCDQCDYAAIRSSHLKTHKFTHSGEKPFKCDQCDSKYSCKKSLKRHKMLHEA